MGIFVAVTKQSGWPGLMADDHDSCYLMSTVPVKEKFEGIEGKGDSGGELRGGSDYSEDLADRQSYGDVRVINPLK